MEIRLFINKYPLEAISLMILALISGLAIYASDSTLTTDFIRLILRLVNYFCAFYVICKALHERFISQISLIILFATMSFWLMGIINIHSTTNPSWSPLYVLIMLGFSLSSEYIRVRAYDLYMNFISLMSIGGLLSLISLFIYPFLQYKLVKYYSLNLPVDYYDFGISYIIIDSNGLFRLCGLFNEPGFYGTVLALVLITKQLNFRDVRVIIMFIAGCFTFSMAFFVTLITYLCLRSLGNIKYLFLVLGGLYLLILSIQNTQFDNPMIANLIKRFAFENGTFAGDNRDSVDTELLMKQFNDGPNVFFGNGIGSTKQIEGMSFRMKIIELGYLGCFVTYGALIYAGWLYAKNNWQAILFLFCFILNLYQRPNVFTASYLLILFGGLLFIKDSNKLN